MRRVCSIFILISILFMLCMPVMIFRADAAGLATSGYLKYSYSGYTAVITDCDNWAVGHMSVPSSLSGYTVVSIQEYAFQNCTNLNEITVPDTVTTIGRGAFMSCSNAVRITLPAEITSISESMFWGCSSLTNVIMGNRITQIRNYAFSGCSNLTEFVIPYGVTSIGDEAFAACSSLETIVIPDSVTSIGKNVFTECTNLSKIIYCGTQAQWDKVYVRSANAVLQATPLQYHVPEGGSCTTEPTCALCGDIAGAPLGHLGEWVELVPLTCVQSGVYARICAACGITESKTIEASGHQGQWQQIQAPSCVDEGINSRTCTVCNTMETVTIPASGHSNHTEVIAPTCTEQGYTSNICTVCGMEEKTDLIPATGHGWSDWIQTTSPSCTAEGMRIRFCNCGARETETLAKLPHSYADGSCTGCNAVMSGHVALTGDMRLSGLALTGDLYIDLNGFDLAGTIITNGYRIYGMDSSTEEYTCDAMGYFSCVDENGKVIVPESLYTTEDMLRYMTVGTDDGYTFHRFYLGITKLSLDPIAVGFGYKAEFYGDELVQSKIDTIGYNLWLTEDRVISRSIKFKNMLTLRLNNFDVENYGEVPIYACVVITLIDGSAIESTITSYSMRQVVEKINESYENLNTDELFAVRNMIAHHSTMLFWSVGNIYEKELNSCLEDC